VTLIGREPEVGQVVAALDRVTSGASPVGIRIEGPAGIGKSTLWQAGVEEARLRGWHVLAARAVASESRLTLGVLADLLAPVSDAVLAQLPEPQRRALAIALFRADPDPGLAVPLEGRMLGTAVRTVLRQLVADRPVLVGIDDAQWADSASVSAIAFALRRLDGLPIAFLLARRVPLALPFDVGEVLPLERWSRVEVGPMALGSINELLRVHGHRPPSRPTLVRIEQASAGNPFFALEIARVLEQRGEPPAGAPLPVPSDIRDLLQERLAAMPDLTRRTLLDLAVLGAPDAGRLRVIAGRDVDAELATAEREGLVRRVDGTAAFAHPLYAAAAMAMASADERRAAHARVASTAASNEEAARHRALAIDGPDAAIAEALDEAASEARQRGAPLAAAELLRLALERTPADDRGALARRRLALGDELKRAGDIPGAVLELEAVAGAEDAASRARARLQLAAIRYETDASPAAAVRLAQEALADAAGDAGLEAHAYAVLGSVDWNDLRNHDRYVAAGERRLAEAPDPDPVVEGILLAVRCGADFRNGRPLDDARIARALELERVAPAPAVADRFSASLGTWLKVLDRFDEARRWLERTRQTAIDEGDDGSLPYALAHLPELEIWTGHWGRAEAVAKEHLALAEATGLESQRVQALYNLALVHAHQGEVAEARREIAEGIAASEAAGDDWMLSGLLPIRGLLELSLGNPAAAVAPLSRSWELRKQLGVRAPTRPGPDLVEALAAAGDLPGAEAVQADLERRVAAFDRPSLHAATVRSGGLVLAASGRLEAARDALEEALRLHDAAPIAFDRARTLLALGQVRRRLRERGAAREAFEQARQAFEELGAHVWAERAAGELERTGLRRGSGIELTATERRVAELAASGLTNRAVAAALFISPKTVDANLGRAYAKLGIRSRAELGAMIGSRLAAADRTNMGDPPM
jgi:DNA-binding CsgD family transcriptional regulator